MITPKFDTMTPLTRTLHRQARPNETLVSLSGSPVMATATVKKAGRGKVSNDFVQRSLYFPQLYPYHINLFPSFKFIYLLRLGHLLFQS